MTDKKWHQDIFCLYWTDEHKHILVLEFHRDYSWNDYYALMGVVAEMTYDIVHPIVYVNIWKEQVRLPQDSILPHFKNMKNMFMPQAVILLMENLQELSILKAFAKAIGLKLNKTYWIVDTYDEAICLAQRKSQAILQQSASS